MPLMTSDPKPPATRPRTRRELLAGRVRAREGAECVLQRGEVWAHARLAELRTDAWGVRLSLAILPAEGMLPPAERTLELETSWDLLRAWPTHWATALAGWLLVFDPATIASLLALAREASAREPQARGQVLALALGRWRDLQRPGRDSSPPPAA